MIEPIALMRTFPRTELRSPSDQRRPIVLVLGMHRSGTSLCSHVLSALGVDMSDKIPGPGLKEPSRDNLRGHWERWEIVAFHDRILETFNRPYLSVTHDLSLPIAWWAEPSVASVRREIAGFLTSHVKNGSFGFKDPRTVRLMPLWHQIFVDLRLAPRIVYCLRNPAQVARSVKSRDGINLDMAEYRWFVYNLEFFRNIKNYEFCTIEYESWFEDPATNLKKLQGFLQLPAYQDQAVIESTVAGIVDNSLRHDDGFAVEARSPLVRSVYKLARRADQDTKAHQRLKETAVEFLSFQQLQAVFEHHLESYAAQAKRLPEIEDELMRLRAALAEREMQLHALERESIGLRDALAEVRNGVEEREASLKVAWAESGLLGKKVNDLEIKLVEREAIASDLRSQLTELRSEREREFEELRNQTVQLRESLARAKREVNERAAAIADQFSKAQQDTLTHRDVKGRPAAEQAIQMRLTLAEEAVADARRVVQKALTVARSPVVVPSEPRLGYRQAMRRVFRRSLLDVPERIKGYEGTHARKN